MKQKPSSVFWDINLKTLNFEKQSNFVIQRILEEGHLEDVKWLLKKYSPHEIKKVICRAPHLSEKTANFWSSYFRIPRRKILCLKKSYLQKRKIFWPY